MFRIWPKSRLREATHTPHGRFNLIYIIREEIQEPVGIDRSRNALLTPAQITSMAQSWHTKMERELIERFGGEWHQQYGVDGELADGSPVEVRVARDDDRFRIGQAVHRELVRGGGSYIFDKVGDGKPPRQVPASEVSTIMGRGKWYDDRDYPHKFVNVDDIF